MTGAVLVGVLGLTGCGIGDKAAEKAGQKATEKLLESAVESDGSDVDIDLDGEEISVESSEGSFTMGGGEIPDGFPSEVPLVEGEVVMTAGGPDGWTVMLKAPGNGSELAKKAVAQVVAAGFTEVSRVDTEAFFSASTEGEAYDVVIAVTGEEEGAATVQYVVEPK